jgi:putative transposase
MPNYRRAFVPGGCWFFTVNQLDRTRMLLTDEIGALREATRWTQERYPVHIDAFVVLPDHLHAVWTLPPDDADFSVRWRMTKTRFALSIPKGETLSAVQRAKGERGIWQRRYWEHVIRDERDYARHIEYCYINPVKHWSGACRIGRIPRFTAMSAPGYFRRTGQARLSQPALSANECERLWRNTLRYSALRKGACRPTLSRNRHSV